MTESSMDRLTDDILADIISRVPYKSTCCCKCVSPRWRDLIAHPDHRAKMPQSLIGFFYETDDGPTKDRSFINALAQGCPPLVDPSLSFLPKHDNLHILHGCNGLLLCFLHQEGTDADEIRYYVVCNPSTEKWVVVPTTEWSSRAEAYLAFDPAVSSHFHVCELVNCDDTGTIEDIAAVVIYSSKTGVWSHEADAWSGCSIFIPLGAKTVFFRGELHFCAYNHQLISIDVEENDWKAIPLPGTANASRDVYLSHGQLHFSCIGLSELSIWVLEDPNSEVWTLKRNISHLQLFGTEYSAYAVDYVVTSIHPEENLVFIVAGHMHTLMSYEMDSMKRRIIDQLECISMWPSENRFRCIPYVPLFLESLADGH
ncbi:F-box protein At1g53790-like [Lolium rigidum]|uniref:F-box protein At1g53790-like n=1 Tax=Lolium rigidum TaxID=89674 RepID=UPI001F5C16A6|nr:F-box protein At1g53790-like [Lolium rigidum]